MKSPQSGLGYDPETLKKIYKGHLKKNYIAFKIMHPETFLNLNFDILIIKKND